MPSDCKGASLALCIKLSYFVQLSPPNSFTPIRLRFCVCNCIFVHYPPIMCIIVAISYHQATFNAVSQDTNIMSADNRLLTKYHLFQDQEFKIVVFIWIISRINLNFCNNSEVFHDNSNYRKALFPKNLSSKSCYSTSCWNRAVRNLQ